MLRALGHPSPVTHPFAMSSRRISPVSHSKQPSNVGATLRNSKRKTWKVDPHSGLSTLRIYSGRLLLRVRQMSPAGRCLFLCSFFVIAPYLMVQLFRAVTKATRRGAISPHHRHALIRRHRSSISETLGDRPLRAADHPIQVQVPMGEYGSNTSSVHVYPYYQREQAPSRTIEYAIEKVSLNVYKGLDKTKKGCDTLADWQNAHHPSCNNFHEIDVTHLTTNRYEFDEVQGEISVVDTHEAQTRFVNNGAYRDVWMIREFDGTKRVLKTLRYIKRREFDYRNFDRHRKDAVSFEQLTASPYIVDIYGMCSNSGLFDYADGGNLFDLFPDNRSKKLHKERDPYKLDSNDVSDNELLRISHRVASSVADAHHLDEKGRATIAHTDIKPDQFIFVNGDYQLNDFNRARLLLWNSWKNEHCGFTVGKNAGVVRNRHVLPRIFLCRHIYLFDIYLTFIFHFKPIIL